MTDDISKLSPEQITRRMGALEGLLHHYLTDDRHGANKSFAAPVGFENHVTINFTMPPTREEINRLMDHLKFLIKVTPESRERVTLEKINSVFADAGLPAIEAQK